MKKVTLLCGLLLAITAGVAAAGPGVNLKWSACAGDGGLTNRNFACASNSGSNVLVASFEVGENIAASSGQEVVIDLAAAGATLPSWWAFANAGSCRQLSLSMNTTISATAANCADWASGVAVGGIGAYNVGQRGANTSRIKIAIAVPAAGLADLSTGQEYFSANITINNLKTVGTGSCAGCSTPVCLVFNSIKCTTQVPANDRTFSGPANGFDSDFATWQGGAGITVPPGPWGAGGSGCGGATATKNATWGAVKALYNR
jgi:hypothetical protein